MNKKAFSTITLIIGIVIAIIILVPTTTYMASLITQSSEKTVCSLSIAMASLSKTAGTEITKINCPMQEYNITKAILAKEEKSALSSIDTFNKDEATPKDMIYLFDSKDKTKTLMEFNINKHIAKAMSDAWRDSGEGNLDLFSNYFTPPTKKDSNSIIPSIQFKKRYCILYAEFRFDEQVKNEFQGQPIRSLNDWMKKNKVPGKDGMTYYDYLQDPNKKLLLESDRTYSLNEPLMIVFARINYLALVEDAAKNPIGIAGSILGGVAGAKITGWKGAIFGSVVGGLLGKKVDEYISIFDKNDLPKSGTYVYVLPVSEVANVCDVLMN